MKYQHMVGLVVVLVGCLFFSVSVRSETIAATQQQTWTSPSGGGSWPTGDQLCAELATITNNAQGYTSGSPYYLTPCGVSGPDSDGAYGCMQTSSSSGCWARSTMYMSLGAYGCPSSGGWTLSGSSCTRPDCATGETRDASGACVRDCNAIKGTSYSGYIPSTASPATVCQNGCNATVVSATNQAMAGGVQVIAGTFSYSGGSCTGNNITGGSPTSSCPVGKCQGMINGVASCFTCSDVTKTATVYTGTSDTTIKTTVYNPDNTTTSSVTDSSTNTTSAPVTSSPSDQQKFCDANPNDVSCMTLDAVPAADSIQSQEKTLSLIQPITVGGAGACPAPAVYTVGGHSATLDYSRYCDFMIAIKPFVLVAAWLSAGLIFIGGVRQ